MNGEVITTGNFKHDRDDGPVNNLPKVFPGDINGSQDFGFAGWPDQAFHYQIELDTYADSITLAFDSTIGSSIADESWGIDNLVITQEIPDPVPFSPFAWLVLLIGLGVLGVTGLRSHQKAV